MCAAKPDPADDVFDARRPFLRATGLLNGLTRRQLEDRGAFTKLHTGIYVDADVPLTPVLRAAAALLPFGPLAYASHATAARVWGLPVPPLPGEQVTVVDAKERRSRLGVTCHLRANGLISTVDGVRVASPRQVFLDLAVQLSLVDMVVVGDHLVRRGRVTIDDLRNFCRDASGPGPRRHGPRRLSCELAWTRRWRAGCAC